MWLLNELTFLKLEMGNSEKVIYTEVDYKATYTSLHFFIVNLSISFQIFYSVFVSVIFVLEFYLQNFCA